MPNSFYEHAIQTCRDVYHDLNAERKPLPKHKAVLTMLVDAINRRSGRITTDQILRNEPFLGPHEVYEPNSPKGASTKRNLWQILRDLRLRGALIVGDDEGLWIPKAQDEVMTFLERNRAKAVSTLKGYNEMTEAIQKSAELADTDVEQFLFKL